MSNSLLKLLYSLSFCVFLSLSLQAQVITNNGKENPHVNYERLTRINKMINEYVEKQWLAGAVALIVKDGQVIQYAGYGYDDIDTKKPITGNNIFRIASNKSHCKYWFNDVV